MQRMANIFKIDFSIFAVLFKVRVCDGCYAVLQRPPTAKAATTRSAESDLPAEYLNSSLAQQVQVIASILFVFLFAFCLFFELL